MRGTITVLHAPFAHGPIGLLDELAPFALSLLPLIAASVWTFGSRIGHALNRRRPER